MAKKPRRGATRRPAPRPRAKAAWDEAEFGDALVAWEAYLLTRQDPWGHPWEVPGDLPEWVAAYLERVAVALLALRQTEPTGDRLGQAVLAALGLDGRGRAAIFARRRQAQQAERHALAVMALVTDGHAPYLAIEAVARAHKVAPSTVGAAYRAAAALIRAARVKD